MLHDGVAGYHVLTVLRVEGSTRKMIVNRGWVGSGSDRRTLPDVSASTEPRRSRAASSGCHNPACGSVSRQPQRLRRTTSRWSSTRRWRARRAARSAVIRLPAVARSRRARGYARDWRAPGVGPERNLVYAGQWLLLAVGALGAAVTITIRTSRRRP